MLTPQGKFFIDFFILKNRKFFFIETNSQDIVNDVIDLFSKYDLRNSLKISKQQTLKHIVFYMIICLLIFKLI